MLCLSRYTHETIVISDDIRITILGIKGNQVRVGIEAPKGIAVNREEVHNRIKAEKRPETP